MFMERRDPQSNRVCKRPKSSSQQEINFSTKLQTLANRARRINNEPLKTIFHFIDEEWLKESWARLNKRSASGIDNLSVKEFESNLEENLKNLYTRIKNKSYKAAPVRRIYIPKADGRKRPLGLPTVEDKIAQRALEMMISAIFDQDFHPMSYGFRRGKNGHQAIEDLRKTINTQRVGWIVDADISCFFDEMKHEWLMKFLGHRIADKSVLRFIKKWLKAGVFEEGVIYKTSTGTPQGGVISPVLANIYLHYVIDLWVTKIVPKYLIGKMWSFRYADDTLFCFQHRKDALRFMEALKKRLAKFGLKLNENKTKICRFGKFAEKERLARKEKRATFNFLGFTFFNSKSRKGNYIVGVKSNSKRMSGCMSRVKEWLKWNRHVPIKDQAKYLNAILRGHYNYYGISGNFLRVKAFYSHVIRTWHKYLSKRSQRAILRWDKFWKILKDNPLNEPHLPRSSFKDYQLTLF